jgi:hypothetical protein
MLLIVDGGQFVRFVVNVICEDFVWFILIFRKWNLKIIMQREV